jgi:phosphatidylserine/phosphatidylglycerophosphate/cardiolipin synthase-like enzyme
MGTEVFFNRPGQPFAIERLYREIRDARHRLTVASAWFTDTHIADAIIDSPAPDKLVLLNAADLGRGDKRAVTMIKEEAKRARDAAKEAFYHDRLPYPPDPRLRMFVLGSRDFTQGVMHHKFIAIDDRMVWTGSFNFTFNAQRNYENLVRIDDPDIVQRFHAEANECAAHIWSEDNDGMVTCSECRERFYPDEDLDLIDSHGGFACVKCRTTSEILTHVELMPSPRVSPKATLQPRRQVSVGKKK